VINNTNKDMVLFQGQTPSSGNIIGGVRANKTRELNVEKQVADFGVGGYMIIRGIALDEYNANKNNLSRAKIEFSAMATYGQGKKFRTEISPNYMGDYTYRVTNIGRIGVELRKDSPDGEKVGYLPALASNSLLYADSQAGFAIYPVLIFYSKSSGQVTALAPSSQFDSVGVSPRPIGDPQIQSYTVPVNDRWEDIVAGLTSPVAYVTISNNVSNQSARIMVASSRLNSQNGYDSIGSGETLTYEIPSTAAGTGKLLQFSLYNQTVNVPIRFEGESNNPVLKNGYDYTVSVSGSGNAADGYTAVLIEGEKRDLSDDLESL
jgi:hypothetical protein